MFYRVSNSSFLEGRRAMSIRPTDLQIIVQKAQEVERVQQSQQQQSKVQQQQFAEQLQKQHEVKERQVNSSPHADEVTIQNKSKNAGQGSHDKGQQEQTSGEADKEKKEAQSSAPEHIIDIKI
ncbi:hypothetical protein [Candidatus Aquicultor secundus]|nr:hypothetical protein [Candidatus Aquicultor secundus]